MATKSTSKTSKSRRASIKPPPANRPTRTAPGKPVVGIGTWVAVILFAALVGFMLYINREGAPASDAEATPTSSTAPLFKEEDGKPTSIEVKPSEGETTRIALNADKAWTVELPIALEANQGLAEAAATQLTAIQIVGEIEKGKDPAIFGLEEPAYTIIAEFDNGKIHTIEVGDNTPSENGYYIRLDKEKMVYVDLSGIDALIQLTFFPPYLNTPTPTALPPTETPVPATEAATTPEAPVTPTP